MQGKIILPARFEAKYSSVGLDFAPPSLHVLCV